MKHKVTGAVIFSALVFSWKFLFSMPLSDQKTLIPIVVPDLGLKKESASGSTPEQGELTAWYQEQGNRVEIGSLLYQISYSGISIDVTSSRLGILKSRTTTLREQVASGEIIGYLDPLAD